MLQCQCSLCQVKYLLLPVGNSAWSDCMRDLKRTLKGGPLYVFGLGRSGAWLFFLQPKRLCQEMLQHVEY